MNFQDPGFHQDWNNGAKFFFPNSYSEQVWNHIKEPILDKVGFSADLDLVKDSFSCSVNACERRNLA